MIDNQITHGLVIDTPWIDKILVGNKVWEMRSRATARREYIALIKKGTKHIFGIAEIYACVGPLTQLEIQKSESQHQVPASIYQHDGFKWNFAWKLKNVRAIASPIPYVHKPGAVIWVSLDERSRSLLQVEQSSLKFNDKC